MPKARNPLLRVAPKRCTHCGRIRSLSRFYKMASASGGLTSQCKDCLDEQTRKRRNDQKLSTFGPLPEGEKAMIAEVERRKRMLGRLCPRSLKTQALKDDE